MKANVLLFTTIIILLISCKKDKVEPNNPTIIDNGGILVPDYSHLTGSFLFEMSNSSLYQQNQSWINDRVTQMTVSGDTLRFYNLNYPYFIITSDTQTVFTYSNTSQFEDATATLVYSNNFEDIQYDYYSTSLAFGPDTDKSYTGSRTSLLETAIPHPYLNEIETDYIMTVVKKDFWNGLDTSYVDTLTVTVTGSMTFDLDNLSFNMLSGHSHGRHQFADWSSSETVNIKRWHRTQDSLYIEQLDYVGLWSTPHDSVQTMYYGAKL